jgi:hypothetical protein
LSDIEALLSRLLRQSDTNADSASKPPPEKPAMQQPR